MARLTEWLRCRLMGCWGDCVAVSLFLTSGSQVVVSELL